MMSRSGLIDSVRVLTCFVIMGGAAASLPAGDPSQKPPNAQKDANWIEKRIADWQPTKAERAFEEIGWAGSLGEAESLAKKHGRAIFLFTYDGASLTGYRC